MGSPAPSGEELRPRATGGSAPYADPVSRSVLRHPGAGRIRTTTRLSPLTLLVILVVALAVRITYVALVLRHYVPRSDAGDYLRLARSVADGHGLSIQFPYAFEHATAFRPPLYPLVLGAVFWVTGGSLGVAEAVNVLLGCAVVLLVAVLAARFAGRRAGLVAGLLAAVYPPLLANDGPPLSEPLALALFLGLLLALLEDRVLTAGVLAGLLVLTRPSAQLVILLVAIWLLVRTNWKRASVFVVLAGLVVAPWLVRNVVVFGSPVLLTSNGFNVAAGWSPEALQARRSVDPVYDPRFAALRSGDAAHNEARLDAAFLDVGLHGLASSWHQVPQVLERNARYLLDLSTRHDNGAERLDGRNLQLRHASLPFVWLMLGVGLGGLVFVARRRDGTLLLVMAGYFFVISIVTVSSPRLRAPVDVLAIAGVAIAAQQLWQWLRSTSVPAGSPDGG